MLLTFDSKISKKKIKTKVKKEEIFMENATKALLIAAAVLVAIIIISLTLAIVRQGSEAINQADLSEAEKTQFNSKFTVYEGSNVATSSINALLTTVLNHNQEETEQKTVRYVKVSGNGATLATNATSITRVTGSSYYTVQCVYTKGIVSEIKVTKK